MAKKKATTNAATAGCPEHPGKAQGPRGCTAPGCTFPPAPSVVVAAPRKRCPDHPRAAQTPQGCTADGCTFVSL